MNAVGGTPRWAWVAVLVADAAIVAYGLLVLVQPEQLTAGYESHTGTAWSEFVRLDPRSAEFDVFQFRLLGAYNVAFGLMAVAVCTTAFRRGEVWAWWALLFGNLVAYVAPMIYDLTVGEIAFFEVLEYVFLALVLVALVAARPGRQAIRSAVLSDWVPDEEVAPRSAPLGEGEHWVNRTTQTLR